MNAPFTRTTLTREATVVGCGVVGLSSAIRLAEAGFKVKIVARDRTPNTTSDVAAAVWYPFRCGPPDRALGWSRRTFRVFDDLRRDPAAGITMVEGIDLQEEHGGDAPWWKEAVDRFRAAMPEEIVGPHLAGWVFQAPVVAMPAYLAWLEAKAASVGIAIESRTVSSLDALLLETSLVANCTGLGARELCRDASLHPVRGQVVRVAPGHARRFVQAGGKKTPLAYVIPRADCTVLGGTQEVDSWDLTVDPGTASAIRARCVALVPGLADAPVLSHAVGLRPGRPEVRLETERRPGGVLIHNYGHGGGGVTLSWGCADEVARRAAAEIPPP
jgi:D-amino-acid oxidase